MPDIRENVINDVVTAMSPLMDTMRLQMLEGAVRGALRGVKLELECTELSTDLDTTLHMIDCFAACKRLEGCKDSTLDQYLRTAKRLFVLIGKGYREITKDDVRYYLAVRAPQIGPNTLVNERRNLSSFFGWLHDEGHIPRNPVKTIKVRGQDVEVIFFSVDEEIAIREVQCSLRDKAIIAFCFSTGVRVGELAAMDRSNVDLLNASVTFRGEKGRTGKFRTVYLDQWARRYLGKYLLSRTDSNPALFVSERVYDGEPRRLGNAAIEKITKAVVKKAGVETIGTVHVFRRTFATRLAERGCPIEVLQELMGHADPSTTLKHYIAKTGARAKAEWAKYVYAA
ncbi:MAG TPA: tyrosine-type recombinase/integrase [Candidatus Merdisoma merdipullorum]|nr:tyrosine-type recombinase/integrase [Candidatus Merdisoma merdipullorum]